MATHTSSPVNGLLIRTAAEQVRRFLSALARRILSHGLGLCETRCLKDNLERLRERLHSPLIPSEKLCRTHRGSQCNAERLATVEATSIVQRAIQVRQYSIQ